MVFTENSFQFLILFLPGEVRASWKRWHRDEIVVERREDEDEAEEGRDK